MTHDIKLIVLLYLWFVSTSSMTFVGVAYLGNIVRLLHEIRALLRGALK